MIDFPCHCGHKFSVGQDMAGGMLQCPRCGRLNDVPLLSDLPHLSEDGTYNLNLLPDPEEDRVPDLARVFGKERVDDRGVEIDLRPTMQDIYDAGGEEIPLELAGELRPGAPKYDPVTGELVLPVDVQAPAQDAPPPPVAARPVLSYGEFAVGATPLRILLDLFRPVNVIVMLFVLLGHVFLGFLLFLMAAGALLIVLVIPALTLALIAHYGNVVDETGPGGRDELPAPLRSMSWHDDLWGPFRDVMLALGFCYGPAIVTLIFPPSHKQIAMIITLALLGAGTLAAPAALLTTLTSGSILNIRPDRLLGVMARCGIHYVVLVALWVGTLLIYAWGVAASEAAMVSLVLGRMPSWVLLHPMLAFPMLISAIYLMHYFGWYLGLMYRAHHDEFPWVLQRYVGKKRAPAKGFGVLPVKSPPASPPPPARVTPLRER